MIHTGQTTLTHVDLRRLRRLWLASLPVHLKSLRFDLSDGFLGDVVS